jgi:ABC-type amino acid transport system permease subunit
MKKTPFWKIAAKICDLYTTVIRGTPVIIQLLIIYSLTVWTEGYYACMIGFSINSGAYVSEIFRSGIRSIDIGQTEAGRSLGLSQNATHALHRPAAGDQKYFCLLINEFYRATQGTSVAGYIAVQDITKLHTHSGERPLIPYAVFLCAHLLVLGHVDDQAAEKLKEVFAKCRS